MIGVTGITVVELDLEKEKEVAVQQPGLEPAVGSVVCNWWRFTLPMWKLHQICNLY